MIDLRSINMQWFEEDISIPYVYFNALIIPLRFKNEYLQFVSKAVFRSALCSFSFDYSDDLEFSGKSVRFCKFQKFNRAVIN